jgi:hypothetical protein
MTNDALPPVAASAESPEAPPARRCPWCSELLPADATAQCPHCHASLLAEGETRLPGLTEVEAPSAVKARRIESSGRRSRLLSWISGEIDDEDLAPVSLRPSDDAFAPPPRDVRREMLRLQLEADGVTVGADGSLGYPNAPVDEAVPAEAQDGPAAADGAATAATESDAPAEILKAS